MAADPNKAKAAAAARSKKGGRNWKLQYFIWVGGSVGSILVACLLLVLNPDRGPFQIPVNDASVIGHVNRNARTWRASASPFFEGWTIGDAKLLQGVSVSQMGGQVSNCAIPDTPVPESFDAREKWPHCFSSSPIYNMGNCTASWAIATASALSNRYCIASPSDYGELMLSPQHMLSCDSSNRGCNGGDIDTAWNFVEREGLVSESCFPYQADGTVSCASKCSSDSPEGRVFKAASHCVLNSETAIRREVYLNGPVVAPLFLVDDFLVYRDGLYQEMPTATQLTDARRQRIIHAVKIVGWGAQDGKPYWLIQNSWGQDWGDHGFAKVVAGGDPDKREGIVIETYVVAGIPANKKIEDGDSDADFEGDLDLEDIDVDLDDDQGAAPSKKEEEDDDEVV